MDNARAAHLSARILLCAIFAISAWVKIAQPEWNMAYMQMNGMTTMTGALLWAALVLDVVGMASLLANRFVWLLAILLAGYVLILTLVFHSHVSAPQGMVSFVLGLKSANLQETSQLMDYLQVVQICKNLGIMGGLLALMLLDPTRPAILKAKASGN